MFPRLICKNCGGLKFVGDPYYAYGSYYVDVTCVTCADTKDIEINKLRKFLNALTGQKGDDADEQANIK